MPLLLPAPASLAHREFRGVDRLAQHPAGRRPEAAGLAGRDHVAVAVAEAEEALPAGTELGGGDQMRAQVIELPPHPLRPLDQEHGAGRPGRARTGRPLPQLKDYPVATQQRRTVRRPAVRDLREAEEPLVIRRRLAHVRDRQDRDAARPAAGRPGCGAGHAQRPGRPARAAPTARAMPSTVSAVTRSYSGTQVPSWASIAADSRTASIDDPPSRKKLSAPLTERTRRTDCTRRVTSRTSWASAGPASGRASPGCVNASAAGLSSGSR